MGGSRVMTALTTTAIALGLVTGGNALASTRSLGSGGSTVPTDAVAVYHMSEQSGTRAHDASGYGNVGHLVHVTLGAAGRDTSTAYRFGRVPGRNSYVAIPSSDSLNPGFRQFSYTVTWRISPSTPIEHDMRLVKRGAADLDGADVKMELKVDRSRGVVLLQCGFRDQKRNAASIYLKGVWNDGLWHTTTCKKQSHRIEMISDGRVLTKTATLGNMSSDSTLYLGIERNPTRWAEQLVGRIDDVVITNSRVR